MLWVSLLADQGPDCPLFSIKKNVLKAFKGAVSQNSAKLENYKIRLNHSPPCWMQRHHFSYESEATRVKTIMAESMSTSTSSEFWHRNLVDIPLFTSAFIDKMASENLPVKVTMTRGYKFFHESYIHDVEGKLPDVTALSVIAR